jgi:hypothetical protein
LFNRDSLPFSDVEASLGLRQAVKAAREREGEAAELRAHMLATRAWRGWHKVTEEERDVRLLKEVADGARADRYAHR